VGGSGVALTNGAGATIRPETIGTLDVSQLALTRTDLTLVRANGTHEVVSIDAAGHEVARQAYQVPILPRRSGFAPYTARWAFALIDANDAVWFAQEGRPEVYRVH
jgi:hypothetical protein